MAELNHIDYSLTAEPIVNIAVSSETSIGVEGHKKRVRTCKYITAEQKAEQRAKRLDYNKQYYREITLENKPLVTEISEDIKQIVSEINKISFPAKLIPSPFPTKKC